MPAPAAIAGTFAEIRTVKSRSVVVLCIEVPIEQAKDVIDAFGFPQPGAEIAVAVARIKPEAVKPAPERERKPWAELSRAQQAGIRCGEASFSAFIDERGYRQHLDSHVLEGNDRVVRRMCGCESRTYLDSVTSCAQKWDALDREYRAWLDAPKYGAA